jgi:hypothetical protein
MTFKSLRDRVGSPTFLALAAVLLIYPAVDLKIQAGIWHLWYGDEIRLHQWVIPIPKGWIAENSQGGGIISLAEVGTYHRRGENLPPIVVSDIVIKDRDFASCLREEYFKSIHATVFDRRTVDIDGEEADCDVTNSLVSELPHAGDSIVTVQCESATGGISITSTGDKENVDNFFSFVSQIRKEND